MRKDRIIHKYTKQFIELIYNWLLIS
jgi:hypothetical protein